MPNPKVIAMLRRAPKESWLESDFLMRLPGVPSSSGGGSPEADIRRGEYEMWADIIRKHPTTPDQLVAEYIKQWPRHMHYWERYMAVYDLRKLDGPAEALNTASLRAARKGQVYQLTAADLDLLRTLHTRLGLHPLFVLVDPVEARRRWSPHAELPPWPQALTEAQAAVQDLAAFWRKQ
jgi:hypothetical protein